MTCDYVIWTNLTKLWPFVAAHILHVVGSCMEVASRRRIRRVRWVAWCFMRSPSPARSS